jgi:uncharacterized protein (TIGR00661 family)
MIVENINKIAPRPRVLVAALDWGLGHATRCIPIINVLIEHNVEVILAADGPVAKLLQNEYPSIVILRLKGYEVSYSRSGFFFPVKLLLQVPQIISTIRYEKKWLRETVINEHVDAVISDNRFGLSLKKIPCVYVTHQLSIQTGNSLLDKIVQKINYRFINRFNECWVPDINTRINLAGNLSHPVKLPLIPIKYLGVLSRCKPVITTKKYDLLILISGPEPQRSILENILLQQLKNVGGKIAMVRGLPGSDAIMPPMDHVTFYNHLPAVSLNELIQQSETIVARCGYSTVMDLVMLKRRAILIPTPGQTEQQYLANHLLKEKLFFTCSQDGFLLQEALDTSRNFDFLFLNETGDNSKPVIEEWIKKLTDSISVLQ